MCLSLLALAQSASAESGWLAKFEAEHLMFFGFFGLGALVALVAIIAYYWREHRQAEYQASLKQAELDAAAKKVELEGALKRDMLGRGFSADDIERVLRAQLAGERAKALAE
jgi:hypothetical protein